MKQCEQMRSLLIQHCQTYPQLKLQDLFKFLYQSSFGCEHMISSPEKVIHWISQEQQDLPLRDTELVETLGTGYSRVHLDYLHHGMRAETLGKLFCLSAKQEPTGLSELIQKLDMAAELIRQHLLPFSLAEFEKESAEWKSKGYPAIHHSDAFRQSYHPAYRVIANEYVPFLPLFARLDEMLFNGPVKLAVEGGSAAGKTTFSNLLEQIYDCAVFHMDDFFLRPEQRCAQRYAEPGGNVDRERFLDEVLIPLSKNETVYYRRFDCSTFEIAPAVTIAPKRLTVIEGAYSMHPDLAAHYDLSIFLDIPSELQKQRILKRNSPQLADRFFHEWIPLEHRYFEAMHVRERCDLSLSICEESSINFLCLHSK